MQIALSEDEAVTMWSPLEAHKMEHKELFPLLWASRSFIVRIFIFFFLVRVSVFYLLMELEVNEVYRFAGFGGGLSF